MDCAVLDTDVVSFLFKGDHRAELYRPYLTGKLLVISFMTLAELDRWALERNWGEARRAKMEQHVRNFIIYPFHRDLCLKWAEVTVRRKQKGRPLSCADAWIAATALFHNIPLISHNGFHFQDIEGLNLITRT
jgi:tRNA(fMet)-specific endonuclease VapC